MHIILEDGFAISKGTGIGQHTWNLFHWLKESPEISSIRLIEKPFLSKISSRALRRAFYIIWLNSWLQLLLRQGQVDVVYFTNYLVPILRLSKVKYMVTLHDLCAWRFPETLPSIYVAYSKWATSHAVQTADLILTLTDTVKREVMELFNIDSKKIYTVYNGIAQSFWESSKKSVDEVVAVKDKFGIRKDYLLFVGTIEERKNVMTLIKAFDKLRNYKNLQLVLVGRPGYGFSKISNYLEENHLENEVIITKYVTEEEKITLYDSATTFVFPSLYEGFGIPLVEAMVRKVPIVASKIPSTEEVAGEAALYYGNDVYNHEALAEQILQVVENDFLRQELVKKGLKRAQEFCWEKVGQRYIEACQELLRGK